MRNLIQYTQDVKIPWRRELRQGEFEQLFEITKTHKYGIMEAISVAYRAGYKSGMNSSKLKAARLEKGLTQEALAKCTGVDAQIINRIESGAETLINTRSIAAISDVLGKQPSEIFL